MIGPDGGGQFGRAGAETEVACDRGIRDAEIVIDLGAVVNHVERPIGIQLDVNRDEDRSLIVGQSGAEAGKSFRRDSLAADPHDDPGRIPRVVAVGSKPWQVVHGIEGDNQSLTKA